ncbi:MAG TPA: hypothetical protein VFO34_09020 [Candidatus Acidoferrales bacterium]|nr:hypothetical protein [Candidatus Acidoferrales bacterium]
MKNARSRTLLTLAATAALLAVAPLRAQEKPAPEESKVTPLKIQVVLSEFDGTKKISTLPYVFYANADEPRDTRRPTSIRFGLRVPVATGPVSTATNPLVNTQFTYMDVGTNIDCIAYSTSDGRYRLELSIDRSSLYSPAADKRPEAGWGVGITGTNPIMQHFNSSYHVIVRDGQPVEATTTTDPVSGHVLVVSVTATVMKETK